MDKTYDEENFEMGKCSHGSVMLGNIEIAITDNAYFEADVTRYSQIEEGFQSWEGWVDKNGHLHQYKAAGVDIDGNAYTVYWAVINPDCEDEHDSCNWFDHLYVKKE